MFSLMAAGLCWLSGNWYHARRRAADLATDERRAKEDITARKQAEERLLINEHRLRLAMEAAGTGMWEWDVTSNAVAWSPECYAIHGVREGELASSQATTA
jgi:PAS domain-containing protein